MWHIEGSCGRHSSCEGIGNEGVCSRIIRTMILAIVCSINIFITTINTVLS